MRRGWRSSRGEIGRDKFSSSEGTINAIIASNARHGGESEGKRNVCRRKSENLDMPENINDPKFKCEL